MNKRFILKLAATGAAAALVSGGFAVSAQAVPAAPHGPKNVIVMIGDGMGYNQIAQAALYERGVSYKQVAGKPGAVKEITGTPAFSYEKFPVQLDMQTIWSEGSYDATKAWADFDYVKDDPTDSAAAGTAMATGHKTYNAGIGVDAAGNPVENISERALKLGKAAGSISSVQYSHATPASYVAHNKSRNDYIGIAKEEVASDMTVIMGAGHPYYTDNNTLRETPSFRYIGEDDFTALKDGKTGFDLVESKADFEALTKGDTPDRVFGIAQVATTLQQSRSGKSDKPFDTPFNQGVPTLETMTKAALNVLDNDPDGFSLMVEGGAIDWAGHANQKGRNIEEMRDFNASIDAVIDWVETNSSWKETLVIVTADHETGYLEGPGSDPAWTLLTGAKGEQPNAVWHSGDHTNQLVPLYVKGAGAKELSRYADMTDPVRGAYLDNTALAKVLLDDLWADGPGASAGQRNGKGPKK